MLQSIFVMTRKQKVTGPTGVESRPLLLVSEVLSGVVGGHGQNRGWERVI